MMVLITIVLLGELVQHGSNFYNTHFLGIKVL